MWLIALESSLVRWEEEWLLTRILHIIIIIIITFGLILIYCSRPWPPKNPAQTEITTIKSPHKQRLYNHPTLLRCFESHGHDIGASVGLAHGQRSHVFARQQLDRRRHNLRTDSLLTLSASDKRRSSFASDLRQELLLLLRVGVAHHLVDTQVRMGTVAEGDATRHSGHFLHHNDVIEVAQTDSTVFH